MHIIIATTQVPFIRGGAEILAEGLRDELLAVGHEVEIVSIPFKWHPPEVLVNHMLSSSLIDLTSANRAKIDLVIGLKFPAYLVQHNAMRLWLIHQHRQAYDLWESGHSDLKGRIGGKAVKELIETADKNVLKATTHRFTISKNVSNRLRQYCDVDSAPLYHPPLNEKLFRNDKQGNYLFFPSRLGELKRQALAIEAMALTNKDARLVIAGAADNTKYLIKLRQLVGSYRLEGKIRFLDKITEQEKIRLYSECLGVLYPPYDEDYGYVSLEAMLSGKPIITCRDSGGPLEFMQDGETGILADGTAESLARAVDRLYSDRRRALRLGTSARELYSQMGINWRTVVERLTE